MKLILSRKGFDSQYGGMPSPILPDGRLVPLPIRGEHDGSALGTHDTATFGDLNIPDIDVGGIVEDLSARRGQRHRGEDHVHLDPDLDRAAGSRLPGWRPALGQTGAAQGHLRKQRVSGGDTFLFFGWFRQIQQKDGVWRYDPAAPDLHVLFGWLEIGEVVPIVGKDGERQRALARFPWLADHPHLATPSWYDSERNTIYVGAARSSFAPGAPHGGGRFSRLTPRLQLTARESERRGLWSLPSFFDPTGGRAPMSYHGKTSRWTRTPGSVNLAVVDKGQEFVLDGADYPELEPWLGALIAEHV